MNRAVLLLTLLASITGFAQVSEVQTLWRKGDNGVAIYRIPAICTAPNGDLVTACDARKRHGGDLDACQEINISIRRSTDNGKTWTEPVNSWTWDWNDNEHWAGSDPSFIVDMKAKKIFLFYNVWECKNHWGVYRFYVQESADNGKTWSKPRDITMDIAHPDWPFGGLRNKGAFIFISSGSGIQAKDGTLLHTLVRVGVGNLLFGSKDHGKTWHAIGNPTQGGDECKIVELANGNYMINSRCGGAKRLIHISQDQGKTWASHFDTELIDPGCNAQIMRYGKCDRKIFLYSGCKARGRSNVTLRASKDDGKTWSDGITICPGGSAYSDITILKDKSVGVLYEGAGYATIDFVVVPFEDIKEMLK